MADSHTCPLCGLTSWHPVDVETGWCTSCQVFGKPADVVAAVARSVAPDVGAAIAWRLDAYGTVHER